MDRQRADLNAGEFDAAFKALPDLKGKGNRKIGKTGAGAVSAFQAWIRGGGTGPTIGTDAQFRYLRGEQVSTPEADEGYRAAAPLFEAVNDALDLRERIEAAMAICVASRARAHVEAELLRRRQLTYDAMLSRLADRVEGQGATGPLAAALRSRFKVALVDEFQDTDAAQWTVMRSVFAHGDHRLLLIGDPKQAIYAFRDADVHVYLKAKSAAQHRYTMTRNFRTDAPLVHAMNHLWVEGSRAFDMDAHIMDYVEVDARHQTPRLKLAQIPRPGQHPGQHPGHPPDHPPGGDRASLELRWADNATARGGDVKARTLKSAEARRLAARLCAREARTLLLGGARALQASSDSVPRNLKPGDLAVLVNNRFEAADVDAALGELGIPCVRTAREGVFSSEAATWLMQWLRAVAAQGRGPAARTLFVSPLMGRSLRELDEALSDPAADAWTRWVGVLSGWARIFARGGFARAFEVALDEHAVLPRLLGGDEGERHATDLRHLMELCHEHQSRTFASPAALATWLQDQRAEEAQGAALDSRPCASSETTTPSRSSPCTAARGSSIPWCCCPSPGRAAARRRAEGRCACTSTGRCLWTCTPRAPRRGRRRWRRRTPSPSRSRPGCCTWRSPARPTTWSRGCSRRAHRGRNAAPGAAPSADCCCVPGEAPRAQRTCRDTWTQRRCGTRRTRSPRRAAPSTPSSLDRRGPWRGRWSRRCRP